VAATTRSTPNPSIEGTASGLRPPAAPHVERYASQTPTNVLVVHNCKAMSPCPLHKLFAIAALLQALPSFAVSCEDLRAEVESKIRSTGVAQFTVAIVEASASAPGRLVGTCDQGSRKLLYTQAKSAAAGTKAPAEPSPSPTRQTRKVEPILTECKDGSVSINSDCKK
jgi:Protein of unknown function (DUF1161)